MGYVEVGGLACPAEHEDSDIDYTQIADYPRWLQRGTTADGRAWYENEYTNSQFRFLYYSDRAEGWFITATAPDLDEDDPWVGGNNAARLVDAEGEGSGSGTPDGVYPNAMLYCGHDTGDAAEGCSAHPRDDGRYFYWCSNDGAVSVSCR